MFCDNQLPFKSDDFFPLPESCMIHAQGSCAKELHLMRRSIRRKHRVSERGGWNVIPVTST